MYCNGDPDLTRTDIPNSSVVKNMPKAAETGNCAEGYYCYNDITNADLKLREPATHKY